MIVNARLCQRARLSREFCIPRMHIDETRGLIYSVRRGNGVALVFADSREIAM